MMTHFKQFCRPESCGHTSCHCSGIYYCNLGTSSTSIKTSTGQGSCFQHQCYLMNGSLGRSARCETALNASDAFNRYWFRSQSQRESLRTEPTTDLPSRGGGYSTNNGHTNRPDGSVVAPLVQPSLPSEQPSVPPGIAITDDPMDEPPPLVRRDEDSDSDEDSDEDEE
jgi:hypothetical protein